MQIINWKRFKKFYILLLVLVLGAYASLYKVAEYQFALTYNFGAVTKNSDGTIKVVDPGLHFKWPFVTRVQKVMAATHTLTIAAQPVHLKNQDYVILDYYIRWRVSDVGNYLLQFNADHKETVLALTNVSHDILANYFSKVDSDQVLAQRTAKTNDVVESALDKRFADFGIEIEDFQVTNLELPAPQVANILRAMESKYSAEIEKIKAENNEILAAMRSESDRLAKATLAKARVEAAKIRAAAEKKVTELYKNAYNMSPEFYKLHHNLEIYRNTLTDKNDILLLNIGSWRREGRAGKAGRQ